MMKDEFEALLDGKIERPLTNNEWNLVNRVYTFHPAIKDVGGKQQVARLWKEFGPIIFQDMLPRAEKAAELDHKRNRLRKELDSIEDQMKELSILTPA